MVAAWTDDDFNSDFLNAIIEPLLLVILGVASVIRLRSIERIYTKVISPSSKSASSTAEYWLPEGTYQPVGWMVKWAQVVCCVWLLVANGVWLALTVSSAKHSKSELIGAATSTASWSLCSVVVFLELRQRVNAGRSVRVWWILHLLLAVIRLRTDINAIKSHTFHHSKETVCWARVSSFAAALFLGGCGAFQHDSQSGKGYARPTSNPLLPTTEIPKSKRLQEANASFFSRILFTWLSHVLAQGARSPLEHEDLPHVQTRDCCVTNFQLLYTAWTTEEKTGRRSFFWALCKAFGGYFWTTALFKLVNDCAVYMQPYMIKRIVSLIECGEDEAKDPDVTCPNANSGYIFAVGLFAAATCQSWCVGQYFFRGFKLGLRIRAAVNQCVYRKALRLSHEARQEFGIGAIVSYMQIDAQKLMDATPYLHMIWSAWFQLSIATYLLFAEIQWAAFAGMGVMIILMPINIKVAKKQQKFTRETMQRRDKRVKLTNEVLQGIRIVKMFSWCVLRQYSFTLSASCSALSASVITRSITLTLMLLSPLANPQGV
jgi:ABC-type multidrug transport system fused ATPase/permease subunit